MSQIAGFKGVSWDARKVELPNVAAVPIADPAAKLVTGQLVRDPTRAVYRYHQTFAAGPRSLVRKSFFAAVGLEPWSANQLRAHEETNPRAHAAAVAGVAAQGVHTDAVLAGYHDAPGEVDRIFRRVESERPMFDVTTADGTGHRLWRVSSAEIVGKLRPLFAPKRLTVLDGHARYEGMLAYREALAAKAPLAMYSSANYGLACLVNLDDPALAIGPRHRVVTAPGGIAKAAVLAAAKSYFVVEPLPGAAKDLAAQFAALAATTAHQPAFIATFGGDADAYKLTLPPEVSPAAAGVAAHRAIQKYDPVVVEQLFLAKAVPGATWRTETDGVAVLAATGAGGAGAALGLIQRPLTVGQIEHAVEQGALLPFGSTSFHPQVARVIAYIVDPDEDLV